VALVALKKATAAGAVTQQQQSKRRTVKKANANNLQINKGFLFYWQSNQVKFLLKNILNKGELILTDLNSLLLAQASRNKQEVDVAQVLKKVVSIDTNNHSESRDSNTMIINNNTVANATEQAVREDNFSLSLPFSSDNSPIVNQYLKSMSVYNMKKKGFQFFLIILLIINL